MEYGCIGEKLGHSFSKEIHNVLADYDYCLQELKSEDLLGFFANRAFKAINVTIPYKQDVIKYLDWISDAAKAINAVNTIVNKDGKLYGYNTDFYGLKALIERENISLKGKIVAILGTGGTAKTANAVAESMGADKVLRISRESKPDCITYKELYEKYNGCEIIINTTPCGMYPETGVSAVDLDKLPRVEAVFDAVYNPLKSKLVLDARDKNIAAVGGLYMLVAQAAFAVEKFTGKPVEIEKIESVFNELYKEKTNIILIGMPTGGKTAVSAVIENILKKVRVDTDDEISKREKKTISEIFSLNGEGYFRAIEKTVVSDFAKQNSKIISTGGGVVLDRENIENLRANGRIYFIDRPLEMLTATADRPLSSNRADLERLYNERYELYKAAADVVVDGSVAIEAVAKKIEDDFDGYTCD